MKRKRRKLGVDYAVKIFLILCMGGTTIGARGDLSPTLQRWRRQRVQNILLTYYTHVIKVYCLAAIGHTATVM